MVTGLLWSWPSSHLTTMLSPLLWRPPNQSRSRESVGAKATTDFLFSAGKKTCRHSERPPPGSALPSGPQGGDNLGTPTNDGCVTVNASSILLVPKPFDACTPPPEIMSKPIRLREFVGLRVDGPRRRAAGNEAPARRRILTPLGAFPTLTRSRKL